MGYTCLFGVLGLLVTSSVRVTADLGTGLINGVIYGIIVIIAIIPGRPPQNSLGIWKQVQLHAPQQMGPQRQNVENSQGQTPWRS